MSFIVFIGAVLSSMALIGWLMWRSTDEGLIRRADSFELVETYDEFTEMATLSVYAVKDGKRIGLVKSSTDSRISDIEWKHMRRWVRQQLANKDGTSPEVKRQERICATSPTKPALSSGQLSLHESVPEVEPIVDENIETNADANVHITRGDFLEPVLEALAKDTSEDGRRRWGIVSRLQQALRSSRRNHKYLDEVIANAAEYVPLFSEPEYIDALRQAGTGESETSGVN